jgi:hypothetical protein
MLEGICTEDAMTQTPPPPRLHVIPARGAAAAAVLARGTSSWFHVLRWDTAAGVVGQGAWLRTTIYRYSVWRHELGDRRPDPVEAPGWARR